MLEINQLMLVNNECYISGKKHTVKGVMYHSTGANNKKLSRYVGPDDGILGVNPYGNHWNTFRPGGRQVCVHGFIGIDKNGKVRLYQTLPWDMIGWHSGKGSKGSANYMGYIGIEICEDALNDRAYFMETIDLMNRLTAYLSLKYNFDINSTTVISHSEGHKLGIASNHADIEHWSRKFNYTMDDARKEVQRLVSNNIRDNAIKIRDLANAIIKEIDGGGGTVTQPEVKPEPSKPTSPTIKVGSKVKVKGSNYATGQVIPAWVKTQVYSITQITGDRALLGGINSWVYIKDLTLQ